MTIGKVIDDFRCPLPDADIYVYDNNSSDETSKVILGHGATGPRCVSNPMRARAT